MERDSSQFSTSDPGSISVVIPSFQRGHILIKTLEQLLQQDHRAEQIIVVDQTDYSEDDPVLRALQSVCESGDILLIREDRPSIPGAMNIGLKASTSQFTLFLDDDIKISREFIHQHRLGLQHACEKEHFEVSAQVGQVLQPGETEVARPQNYHGGYGLYRDLAFPFNSSQPALLWNCMAGNLCVNTQQAIECGGFDENFRGAAYRFETEFARRLVRHTQTPIHYWPRARIDHLQWSSGGTRAQASHLTSPSPIHSMGDYYFALRESIGWSRFAYIMRRLGGSMWAKFYLRRPWYLASRFVAEFRGLMMAIGLARMPARHIEPKRGGSRPESKNRLAILMSHPTQHFAPVYRHLSEQKDIVVQVFFLATNGSEATEDPGFGQAVRWDVPLTSGYKGEFLKPNQRMTSFTFRSMDHPNAIAALNDFQPDTLWVHGYGQKANWRALFCLRRKLQVIYSSDSNLLESRGFLKRWVKQSLLRIFFARCDHFLAISESNETYLKYYGVSAQKIHRVPFPIDMQFWCAEARRVSDKQSCQQLKDKLGIGLHSRVFLFAGKLLAHKAPDDLVHAFARLADKDAFLIIIGNGPKKENLMTLVSELGLKTRVHFTGFLNQQELGNYFAVSDVLVFPSHKEPYGAIAAEVLPFGLALIVSDQVGALGGPVQTDANALVYPAGDVAKLAACINSLVDDEVLLEKFAKHSRALAEAQDAGHMAKTIGNLCRLPQNIF